MGSNPIEEAIALSEEMSVEIRQIRRELEELKDDDDTDAFDGGPDMPPSTA